MKKKAATPAERSAAYRARKAKALAAAKERRERDGANRRGVVSPVLYAEFRNELIAYAGGFPNEKGGMDYLYENRNGGPLIGSPKHEHIIKVPTYRDGLEHTQIKERIDVWTPQPANHHENCRCIHHQKTWNGQRTTYRVIDVWNPKGRVKDGGTRTHYLLDLWQPYSPIYSSYRSKGRLYWAGRGHERYTPSPPDTSHQTNIELRKRELQSNGKWYVNHPISKKELDGPCYCATRQGCEPMPTCGIKSHRRWRETIPHSEFAARHAELKTKRQRDVAAAQLPGRKQYTPQPEPIPASSWGRYSEHAGAVADFADYAEYINNEVITPAELRTERGADDDAFDDSGAERGAADDARAPSAARLVYRNGAYVPPYSAEGDAKIAARRGAK